MYFVDSCITMFCTLSQILIDGEDDTILIKLISSVCPTWNIRLLAIRVYVNLYKYL